MKKILLTLGMIMVSTLMMAQAPQGGPGNGQRRMTPEQMRAMKPQDWGSFARYAEANKAYNGDSKVLFYGDSITDFWINLSPNFFSENNFLDRGISGQTVEQMLTRMQQDVVDLKPRIMVFLGGINNIAENQGPVSQENIVAIIKSICEVAKANKIVPILCSVMPCDRFFWAPYIEHPAPKVAELNAMLKAYAEKAGIVYVDYYSQFAAADGSLPAQYSEDGCHPNAAGYAKMEEIVLPVIKQTAKKNKIKL